MWDVRGSGAFVCGHWCVYEHVCVPMYASMLSLYMCYACMCTCVYSLIVCVPLSLHVCVSVHTCTCLSPPPPAHAECHNVYSSFDQFAVHCYCTVEE